MTIRLQLDVKLNPTKMSEIRRTADDLLQQAVCSDADGNQMTVSLSEIAGSEFGMALREVLHAAMEQSKLLNKLSIEVADIVTSPVEHTIH